MRTNLCKTCYNVLMTKVYSVILASGSGKRFDQNKPKQFAKIAGKTVLEHTLDVFENSSLIHEIILVINPHYRDLAEAVLADSHYKKIKKVLNGGQTRRESSFIGVGSIGEDSAKVLIHDAVRPFVPERVIKDCVDALDKYSAAGVAIKSADTIIRVNDRNIIEAIPERKYMMRIQTPQAFRAGVIKKAHELAAQDESTEFTDDCGLVVKYNLAEVYVVEGEEANIKITYPQDICLAENLLKMCRNGG